MITGLIHSEWLNQNSNRKYPFFDGCSMLDSSGTMTLPSNLIVDLSFSVTTDINISQFYLKQLTIFAGGVTIEIGYASTGTIATVTVNESTHTTNKSYLIYGSGDFADSVGVVNIGAFDDIKKYGGAYSFTLTTARFLPTVFRPALIGVAGIRVINGENETSELLKGEVQLVAGGNMVISAVPATQTIELSAVNNANYEDDCDCPDTPQGEPIRSINGLLPDEAGNFTVSGTNCVEISDATNGIAITDTCAEPCCGCAELEVLRTELTNLGSQIATERAFAQRAMAVVEQLRDVILPSKLGTILPC